MYVLYRPFSGYRISRWMIYFSCMSESHNKQIHQIIDLWLFLKSNTWPTFILCCMLDKDALPGWSVEKKKAESFLAIVTGECARLFTIILLKMNWFFVFLFHLKLQSNLNYSEKVMSVCNLQALTQLPSERYFNISSNREYLIHNLWLSTNIKSERCSMFNICPTSMGEFIGLMTIIWCYFLK